MRIRTKPPAKPSQAKPNIAELTLSGKRGMGGGAKAHKNKNGN